MAALLRSSSLIFAFVTIFQFLLPAVLATPYPVKRTTGLQYGVDMDGNGYWWQEVSDSAMQTVQAATLKGEVKKDYELMVKAAEKKGIETKQIPAVYTVFFIPGHGMIGASNIFVTQPGTQSQQTCDVVQDANHRYYGNCAEMNAGAIAVNLKWAEADKDSKGQTKIKLPAGTAISAYGIVDKKTQKTGWLNPCSATEYPGCEDHLELDKVKIFTRDLETAEQTDDAAAVGFA